MTLSVADYSIVVSLGAVSTFNVCRQLGSVGLAERPPSWKELFTWFTLRSLNIICLFVYPVIVHCRDHTCFFMH